VAEQGLYEDIPELDQQRRSGIHGGENEGRNAQQGEYLELTGIQGDSAHGHYTGLAAR